MISIEQTIFTSTDRTAAPTAVTLNTGQALGLHLAVYVTSNASTVGITPTIAVEDTYTGAYYTLLTAAAAITSTGHTVLKLGLGLESTSNIQNDYLPQNVRVSMTHSSTSSIAYSAIAKKFYAENEF